MYPDIYSTERGGAWGIDRPPAPLLPYQLTTYKIFPVRFS